jgi:hypothetical protein
VGVKRGTVGRTLAGSLSGRIKTRITKLGRRDVVGGRMVVIVENVGEACALAWRWAWRLNVWLHS